MSTANTKRRGQDNCRRVFWSSPNELFRLADASGALASRFILLMLTKSFYGQEDRNLTKKLMTELPGILNWSADGWVRLERRGHFQQPELAKEAVEQLEELASPIGAFVRECCDMGPAHCVAIDSLFLAWKGWCTEQGRDHPGTKASFGRDLKAAHPGGKSDTAQRGGASVAPSLPGCRAQTGQLCRRQRRPNLTSLVDTH